MSTTIVPTIYQTPERNFVLQTSKGSFGVGTNFQDSGRTMQIIFISDVYDASDGRRYVNVHAVQIGESRKRRARKQSGRRSISGYGTLEVGSRV